MEAQIQQLREEALHAVESAATLQELESVRVKLFGKKGSLSLLRRELAHLPKSERPRYGALLTELQRSLEAALSRRREELRSAELQRRLQAEAVDVTLPGRRRLLGRPHPITQTLQRMLEIFHGLGYEVAEGPEIETEWYNFDALNTPAHHPARDMHDTFYLSDELLLRTHTSPVQARVMEQRKPPIRIVVPGRVYRRDSDISHSPMFHQLEGLLVDRSARFSDLKGTLAAFARQMFGEQTRVRFRPSFFPFTEPSAEVDITCVFCNGEGCRVCKQSGWLEVLGCGSVDPEVFKAVGYDPQEVRGFAFGMGVDRMAMLLFRIDDIRLFFENDMRFLTQF
ncbi:MAG: phenylalanine--tRNA ligase alpha subunit [Candidatus Poribacteria bacterium]|nr:MAG: phenylalanine--tRNA ligase alpha subunit [Candidatus Poribacteria bacterium]